MSSFFLPCLLVREIPAKGMGMWFNILPVLIPQTRTHPCGGHSSECSVRSGNVFDLHMCWY